MNSEDPRGTTKSARQHYINQTRMNKPEIVQLRQQIQERTERKPHRDSAFASIEKMLETHNGLHLMTDFDFPAKHIPEPKSNIGMQFRQSYGQDRNLSGSSSDDDLESGLRFVTDGQKRLPAMLLQFSTEKRERQDWDRVNLPVRQSGSDQPYQIYNKPP